MVNLFTKAISFILVFLTMQCSPLFGAKYAEDIAVISDNITHGLLDGTMRPYAAADIQTAQEILGRTVTDEQGNCRFSDINYTDPERAIWPAAMHLARTEQLAILYRRELESDKKAEYKTYVLKLLDHWLYNDYTNSNWWHNRLSNPNILGEIAILMRDALDDDRLFKAAQLVGRGCFTQDPFLFRFTGANAVEIAMSSIKFGVLTGSASAIRTAVKMVSKQLDYSPFEGLKKDNTFFQHGNRLYMGGYGISYIKGITEVVGMLSGTEYGFTQKQLTPFTGLILDGLRMMSFGSTLDPTTMGRSVSRPGSQPLQGIVPSLLKLSNVAEMPRKEELKAYAESITNDVKGDYGLHYFDQSKFLVIHNSDFYFSFRGGDNLLFYSENTNNENILSYNSSFPGVTTVMHTGRELTDISPLYNYALVPGTTAVYETDAALAAHKGYAYRPLFGTYGSATDKGAAVLFAKTKHEGIAMTVSCFATDDAVVMLGAGMEDSKGRAMFTTLDQSFAAGDFSQNGNEVVHNGIKYTLLQGENLTATKELRSGSWRRNNPTLPDIFAQGEVFTLFLPNNGSYAYSVMSANTQATFTVIVNSERIQAVRLPDGRVAAVFYQNGKFTVDGNAYSGKAGTAHIYE